MPFWPITHAPLPLEPFKVTTLNFFLTGIDGFSVRIDSSSTSEHVKIPPATAGSYFTWIFYGVRFSS